MSHTHVYTSRLGERVARRPHRAIAHVCSRACDELAQPRSVRKPPRTPSTSRPATAAGSFFASSTSKAPTPYPALSASVRIQRTYVVMSTGPIDPRMLYRMLLRLLLSNQANLTSLLYCMQLHGVVWYCDVRLLCHAVGLMTAIDPALAATLVSMKRRLPHLLHHQFWAKLYSRMTTR